MFEQITGWIATKQIRLAQAYGRRMLKEQRRCELQLRREGRFDAANTVREMTDDLERFIEYGYELAPC